MVEDKIHRTGAVSPEHDQTFKDVFGSILVDFADAYPNVEILEFNVTFDEESKLYRYEIKATNEN